MTAKIADTWHLYSVAQPPAGRFRLVSGFPKITVQDEWGIRGPKADRASIDFNMTWRIMGEAEFQLR